MTENPQGPGTELRTARESMDVSVREVADALNLPTHVIEALEADDYERLPPSVFTRGYLRSYARLLELSPELLLAKYPEVTEEVDAVTGEMPTVSLPSRPSLLTLIVGVLAALVLVVFLIWWFAGDGDQAAESDPLQRTPASVEETPVADAQAAPDVDPIPVASKEMDPDTDQLGDGTEILEEEAAAEAVEAVEAGPLAGMPEAQEVEEAGEAEEAGTDGDPPAEAAEPAVSLSESDPLATAEGSSAAPPAGQPVVPTRLERRLTELGDDVVTLTFSEDCWVEVKSLDGENLYSDLNRAGRTLVLTGRAPFRVLLGYAPGVSLSFNGEPVPLERHSRNNVASLVVGAL